jgi:pyruvate dehydrogenase E1 component alpha subunit
VLPCLPVRPACLLLRDRRAVVRVSAVATTAKKDASSSSSASSSSASSSSKLTPEVAKDLYYDMVLGREFEEMCAQMYYR